MQPTLLHIEGAIDEGIRSTLQPIKLIVSRDFNRHHPMWSGRHVYHTILGHAEELLQFMHTRNLQPGLPPGTPTYWSLSRPGIISTLDLMLTDALNNIVKCLIYYENYGSDYRATYLK